MFNLTKKPRNYAAPLAIGMGCDHTTMVDTFQKLLRAATVFLTLS